MRKAEDDIFEAAGHVLDAADLTLFKSCFASIEEIRKMQREWIIEY